MIDSGQTLISPPMQIRRAWTVVGAAFAVFVLLSVVAASAGLWVYRHATEPETATLRVISGRGALLRSPADRNWRLVIRETRVREGDRVSTALGTVVTLTMFDGSTVEVTEDTEVRIMRMRSSRFFRRTKLIVLEPMRGTMYMAMAPRRRYRFSEIIVRHGTTTISMVDGDQQPDAGTFLVQVRDGLGEGPSLRVAVLVGAATIETQQTSLRLVEDQQVQVANDGTLSAIESAVRELILNGDFADGLNGWIEFQRDPANSSTGTHPAASVELVREQTTAGSVVAVEFLRVLGSDARVETGIQQRIGTTLRANSSLLLDFEVRIDNQFPAGGGSGFDAFPLIVEINYRDVDGAERRWRHGYYTLEDKNRPVPDEIATSIDRGKWQRIIFDLHNLDPPPGQVTSIVVYASGQRYATRVANLSLSSSERVDPADQ